MRERASFPDSAWHGRGRVRHELCRRRMSIRPGVTGTREKTGGYGRRAAERGVVRALRMSRKAGRGGRFIPARGGVAPGEPSSSRRERCFRGRLCGGRLSASRRGGVFFVAASGGGNFPARICRRRKGRARRADPTVARPRLPWTGGRRMRERQALFLSLQKKAQKGDAELCSAVRHCRGRRQQGEEGHGDDTAGVPCEKKKSGVQVRQKYAPSKKNWKKGRKRLYKVRALGYKSFAVRGERRTEEKSACQMLLFEISSHTCCWRSSTGRAADL